jgi:hypothetical protein
VLDHPDHPNQHSDWHPDWINKREKENTILKKSVSPFFVPSEKEVIMKEIKT